MSTTSRARRYAVATVTGFAALSLAACGSSSAPSATSSTAGSSSPASASPAPGGPGGKDRISGLVNSVSGGTVSVTGKDGQQGTVNITSTTRVTQLGPGQLTDVTAGECVAVRPVKGSDDNGSAVTAADVLVHQAGNTQCGTKGGGRKVRSASTASTARLRR